MAKKKTRILWLSKCKVLGIMWYELWNEEPKLILDDKERRFARNGSFDYIRDFCAYQFEQLLPALKLHNKTKCKLRLTQLKNGIKLTKVK